MLRRKEPRVHGTASSYSNYDCRCEPCKAAWREYASNGPGRAARDRLRAKRLARGLDQNGRPRKRPYDAASLALMSRHGLEPDGRFLP